MLDILTLSRIEEAHRRIAPYVTRTPTIRYPVNEDCALFLKPESLQSTGAFKIRGAFNLMCTLPKGSGVAAHSSGNHAQAVARAAKVLGMRAVIVMPDNAPALKRQRTAADGAEIITVGPDSDERANKADALVREQGLTLVPPFNHELIAAGQGTCALELLQDVKIDRLYCPVSGGGLMSGCATVVKALCPEAEIVGVEPEDGNDTQLSLAAGERRKVPPPQTIADGLRVRTPGEKTWPVVKTHVSRVALVNDEELMEAMAFALLELRLVLEPSGAASLAVARREQAKGSNGVILSGGNVDPKVLEQIIKKTT